MPFLRELHSGILRLLLSFSFEMTESPWARSLLKSPMLLGCDLTAQVPEVVSVLQNSEATAFSPGLAAS